MNSENAIEVRNLKKKFKVYFDKGHMLKERLIFADRNKFEERWVLNGISFDIKKGEAVGLIGKNGCGKSTTLKLLNRIIYPNEGTVAIKGKVSSLIELGAGFHEDMTGRENIYINASIFGLSKKEIDERLDDIIRFSELEEYIDNPVRTYSSGMYMRLAFSVAISVSADVLLIDEILAVGDVNFQEKCFQKLRDIKRSGTTIVIVSHSLGQIDKICDRAIWIDNGLVKEDGSPRDVTGHYLESMEFSRLERAEQEYAIQQEKSKQEKIRIQEEEKQRWEQESRKSAEEEKKGIENEQIQKELDSKKKEEERKRKKRESIKFPCNSGVIRTGNEEVIITDIRLYNRDGNESYIINSDEQMTVRVKYECMKKTLVDFRLGIFRDDNVHVYGFSSLACDGKAYEISGSGEFSFGFPCLTLLKGKYLLDIGIRDSEGNALDIMSGVKEFIVSDSTKGTYGLVQLNCKIECE